MTTETSAQPAVSNVKMIIGGEQGQAAAGQTFDATNPATGWVIATAPLGGAEDVSRAVKAAQAAFDGPWSTWSASKRGRPLQKYSNLVKQNLAATAQLDS